MTKVIVMLRHAQSAVKQSGQRDYDRELTPQGEADARSTGKKLKSLNFNIDLILSSSAKRTQQTVQCVNETLNLENDKIRFDRGLYEGLADEYLQKIKALPADINNVLVVGHNPELSLLVSEFAGSISDLAPCQWIAFESPSDTWMGMSARGKKIQTS